MPIPSLYAVRLMNADVSAGFQLRFVDDAAAKKGLSMLPELYAWLCSRLTATARNVRCAVEFAVASEEAGMPLCSGLNVRLLFPRVTDAAQASALCLALCEETADWMNRSEQLCIGVRSAQEGMTAQLACVSGMEILTRQRCVCRREDGSLLYYAPAARGLCALDSDAMLSALHQAPGCGVSLMILAAKEGVLCDLRSAAETMREDDVVRKELLDLAAYPEPVNLQIILWEKERRSGGKMIRLAELFKAGGVCCRAVRVPALTQTQRYALIHDPWLLLAWTHQNLGGRLAPSATLYDRKALEALFSCAERKESASSSAYYVHFSPEELRALGVSEEDELLNRSMSREQIDLLRTAVTQVRTVLADRSLSPVMPYAASLGFFYEMMVRACIEPGLLEQENRFRARTAGHVKAYPGEPPLSHFDFISNTRVRNYAQMARVGGAALSPEAWNVWFNCMKCMRLMRNKVHTRLGSVEREELECMYRLMLFPGHEHKLGAIDYVIRHPHPRADDNENRNLKILHAQSGREPAELLDYIARFPEIFSESLLSFILRCADGEWLAS